MQVTMDVKRDLVQRFVDDTLKNRIDAHRDEVTNHYRDILNELFDAGSIQRSNREVAEIVRIGNEMISKTNPVLTHMAAAPWLIDMLHRIDTGTFKIHSYTKVAVTERFHGYSDDSDMSFHVEVELPIPMDEATYGRTTCDLDDTEATLLIAPHDLAEWTGVADCTTMKRFAKTRHRLIDDRRRLEERLFNRIRGIRTDVGIIKAVPQLEPYFASTNDLSDLIDEVT